MRNDFFYKRLECPACGGKQFEALHRSSYADPGLQSFLQRYYSAVPIERQRAVLGDTPFEVSECAACGLVFQVNVPTSELLGELYGRWLGINDPLAPNKPPMPLDYYTYMAQEVMQLVAFLQRRHGQSRRVRFLDYGMGWSNWAQMARAFGVDVYGVELSPAKIKHATDLGFPVLSLDQLAQHKFDFISTEQVIEHLADPREAVTLLLQSLGDGGLIKLSVPDGSDIKKVLQSWTWGDAMRQREQIMPVHPLEHLNCFTPAALRRFGASFGLRSTGLPLGTVYAYSTDWSTLRSTAKNVLRPIKRFVRQRGCYALFERA